MVWHLINGTVFTKGFSYVHWSTSSNTITTVVQLFLSITPKHVLGIVGNIITNITNMERREMALIIEG